MEVGGAVRKAALLSRMGCSWAMQVGAGVGGVADLSMGFEDKAGSIC